MVLLQWTVSCLTEDLLCLEPMRITIQANRRTQLIPESVVFLRQKCFLQVPLWAIRHFDLWWLSYSGETLSVYRTVERSWYVLHVAWGQGFASKKKQGSPWFMKRTLKECSESECTEDTEGGMERKILRRLFELMAKRTSNMAGHIKIPCLCIPVMSDLSGLSQGKSWDLKQLDM